MRRYGLGSNEHSRSSPGYKDLLYAQVRTVVRSLPFVVFNSERAGNSSKPGLSAGGFQRSTARYKASGLGWPAQISVRRITRPFSLWNIDRCSGGLAPCSRWAARQVMEQH